MDKKELLQIFNEKKDGYPIAHAETFALEPSTFDEEKNTIKVRFTNNNKVLRYNFMKGEYYYLQLSSNEEHVNLSRLNSGAAVVDSHNTDSLSNIIGRVVPGSATAKEATIQFSKREEVKPIIEDIKAGIISFVSPGFFVHETKDVTKEGEQYRTLKVTNWEPYEISFVAVPADPQAQSFNAIQQVSQEIMGATKEQKTMDKDTNKEALASLEPKVDVKAIETEALKAENERATKILEITEKAGLEQAFALKMIKDNVKVEDVATAAFNALAEKSKKEEINQANFSIKGGEDEATKKFKAMSIAFDAKIGLGERETGNQFNHSSMFEMAKFAAEMKGAQIYSMTPSEVVQFALHSTSDFANLLSNATNKKLRKAYTEQERTFTPFCVKNTLRDFKQVERLQTSEIATPQLVIEGGEFKQTTISDGKEVYRLNTYGSIIAITRQAIINDDLSAFTRIPTQLGASMARLEGDIVYGILTGNPNMADGNPLFDASHSNVTNARLLDTGTMATYGTFVQLFRSQKGPAGIANLNLYPNFLIVGPAQEVAARRLFANITATTSAGVNPFSGSGNVIVENRLSGNAYYGAANPGLIDTIEYGYLDGEEGPQTFTRNGFEVDGLEIKTRLDFAAKAIDWRGLAKSTNDAT